MCRILFLNIVYLESISKTNQYVTFTAIQQVTFFTDTGVTDDSVVAIQARVSNCYTKKGWLNTSK